MHTLFAGRNKIHPFLFHSYNSTTQNAQNYDYSKCTNFYGQSILVGQLNNVCLIFLFYTVPMAATCYCGHN